MKEMTGEDKPAIGGLALIASLTFSSFNPFIYSF